MEISQAKFYCNPYSILVIDKFKKLRRVYCPFKVVVICNTDFPKGKTVFVSSVKMKGFYQMTYTIDGKEYGSSLFKIIL